MEGRAETAGTGLLRRKVAIVKTFVQGNTHADGAASIAAYEDEDKFVEASTAFDYSSPVLLLRSKTIDALVDDKETKDKPGFWLAKWHFYDV